jgi:hypothetical protein
VVAFCLPYLLYAPYANLGMKVGFIFAPIATLAAIWAYLFLPECKGLRRVSEAARFRASLTGAAWSKSTFTSRNESPRQSPITGMRPIGSWL